MMNNLCISWEKYLIDVCGCVGDLWWYLKIDTCVCVFLWTYPSDTGKMITVVFLLILLGWHLSQSFWLPGGLKWLIIKLTDVVIFLCIFYDGFPCYKALASIMPSSVFKSICHFWVETWLRYQSWFRLGKVFILDNVSLGYYGCLGKWFITHLVPEICGLHVSIRSLLNPATVLDSYIKQLKKATLSSMS